MCRFVDAGRWVFKGLRRPVVFVPLLTWGVLTVLLHLTPKAPVLQFDVAEATRRYDRDDDARAPIDPKKNRMPVVIGITADAKTICTVFDAENSDRYFGPIRLWDLERHTLQTEGTL